MSEKLECPTCGIELEIEDLIEHRMEDHGTPFSEQFKQALEKSEDSNQTPAGEEEQ